MDAAKMWSLAARCRKRIGQQIEMDKWIVNERDDDLRELSIVAKFDDKNGVGRYFEVPFSSIDEFAEFVAHMVRYNENEIKRDIDEMKNILEEIERVLNA
jgi:hypothetical protein